MKIHGEKHRMAVAESDLSGLLFDDANLAGASIVRSRLQSMTLNGIEVNDLLDAWKEREASQKASAA